MIYLAWLCALIATCGSLFFSEVMGYPPCVLCWYQRICMYPLVLILGAEIVKPTKNVTLFALPLTLVGVGIGFYHNLLYYEIIPESAAPCRQGISCTTEFINWFGFVTIPLLSFVTFSIIATLLIVNFRKSK